MKIFFVLIFIGLFSSSAFAQLQGIGNQWVITGVRATFNSTWLSNQNELNDKGLKYKPAWGYSGGLMLGVHYAAWGAICVEGLYSTLSQKQASAIDTFKWSGRTDLTYYEFPVLLHFVPKEYKYIEAGIKISNMAKAQSSYESSLISYADMDVKNSFEKSNLSLVLGWGGPIWGDGGGLVNLGIRLTYGLSDIISTSGGKGTDYYSLNDGITANPKSYTPTNTATIGFHLTYDIDLGWWLHDSCKRKYKFFLFSHG